MYDRLLPTLITLLHRPARRDDRGQTAAEYLGIVVLVGAIITAVVALGLDDTIAGALKGQIAKIAGTKG